MEIPPLVLDFWSIFFLVAGGQAWFISFILFVKKDGRRASSYLALFLFFFGLMLVFNFFFWSKAWYRFSHLVHTNSIINYVFGPLLLLYLDSLSEKPTMQRWGWLHFLPAVILLIHMSPFFLNVHDVKIQILKGVLPWPKGLLNGNLGYLRSFKFFLACSSLW